MFTHSVAAAAVSPISASLLLLLPLLLQQPYAVLDWELASCSTYAAAMCAASVSVILFVALNQLPLLLQPCAVLDWELATLGKPLLAAAPMLTSLLLLPLLLLLLLLLHHLAAAAAAVVCSAQLRAHHAGNPSG
jgi:hypothetical protein